MSEENNNFIKEKIVKKSGAGKSFRNIIRVIVSGILFGVIAAITAALAYPFASKYLGQKEETTVQEMVVIPRDDPETTAVQSTEKAEVKTVPETVATVSETESVPEESTAEDHNEKPDPEENQTETNQETDSAPVKDDPDTIAIKETEPYAYSMDDVNHLWKNISELCNEVDVSVVTVNSVQNEVDLFDNEVMLEGNYSGIVIAETGLDYKILTVKDAVEGKSIRVKWNNGKDQRAALTDIDEETGLAIITVRKFEMDDSTREKVKPIPLGNSNLITRGDLMIGIGSPKGPVHSAIYTWASYIAKNVSTIDGFARLIFTGESCDSSKGTWFVNSSGELIGWGEIPDSREYFSLTEGDAVVGISDFKGLLERMINTRSCAYVGIRAVEVLSETDEKMPEGIYVTDVVLNSPAYDAGIQVGDIISEINGIIINSLNRFRTVIEELEPEKPQEFTVFRESREEYKEIKYNIIPGKR